jgi:NAD(P)-dependent dehydrogenase (short-subunit alcohol dehydrogenase family)
MASGLCFSDWKELKIKKGVENMKLQGKVVFITGACGVLGTAMCMRIAQEGGLLVCADRNGDGLNALVDKIHSIGGRALAAKADVTDIMSVRDAVKKGIEEYQRIDMLVNLAGGPSGSGHGDYMFIEKDFDICLSVITLNLMGAMICAHETVGYMIKEGKGKIVSISSIDGLRGSKDKGKCDYAAAKAGLLGFSKSLAKELAPYKINVNVISLGQFANGRGKNNVNPDSWARYGAGSVFNRFGEPDEAAALVVFLLSDEADYITGQNYIMGGGCYM